MSYEGYDEFLCEKGHHWTIDSMEFYGDQFGEESQNARNVCPVCKGKMKYWCAVDETNGYDEDNPHTYSAPKKEIGFEDQWHEDHYGNKYATKILLFAPDLIPVKGKHWNGVGVYEEYEMQRWTEIKEKENADK